MHDREKSDGRVLPVKSCLNNAQGGAAEVVEGKAPDNRHEKGNERVLHRKTKRVTMPLSHASGQPQGRGEAS